MPPTLNKWTCLGPDGCKISLAGFGAFPLLTRFRVQGYRVQGLGFSQKSFVLHVNKVPMNHEDLVQKRPLDL